MKELHVHALADNHCAEMIKNQSLYKIIPHKMFRCFVQKSKMLVMWRKKQTTFS